jgi:hypothetical protein
MARGGAVALASINIWAVLTAVAAKQALGFLWYSPMVFGKTFAKASGQSPEDMRATIGRGIGGDILGAVLMAVGLAVAVDLAHAASWFYGLLLGLGCWLAFAAPASAGPMLFERRPLSLFALQNGYLAVSLAVMGAIIGAWR